MTFDEMLQEVHGWTKRPDLESRAISAIRSVTLQYHRSNKFFKDLATVTLPAPTLTGNVEMYDLATVAPRFRQVAKLSITGSDVGFNEATLDDILDDAGYSRVNVFLIAGTSLNVRALAAWNTLTLTYYKDPIVWPSNLYSSWIGLEYPDLVIAGAAKRVFAFDNESEIFKAAAAEEAAQFRILVSNNLEAQGR